MAKPLINAFQSGALLPFLKKNPISRSYLSQLLAENGLLQNLFTFPFWQSIAAKIEKHKNINIFEMAWEINGGNKLMPVASRRTITDAYLFLLKPDEVHLIHTHLILAMELKKCMGRIGWSLPSTGADGGDYFVFISRMIQSLSFQVSRLICSYDSSCPNRKGLFELFTLCLVQANLKYRSQSVASISENGRVMGFVTMIASVRLIADLIDDFIEEGIFWNYLSQNIITSMVKNWGLEHNKSVVTAIESESLSRIDNFISCFLAKIIGEKVDIFSKLGVFNYLRETELMKYIITSMPGFRFDLEKGNFVGSASSGGTIVLKK